MVIFAEVMRTMTILGQMILNHQRPLVMMTKVRRNIKGELMPSNSHEILEFHICGTRTNHLYFNGKHLFFSLAFVSISAFPGDQITGSLWNVGLNCL
jgi:hypothetical protein